MALAATMAGMPPAHLVEPDVRFHESFLRAMDGFRAEGRGGPDDRSSIGRALASWEPRWRDQAGFAAYVDALRAERLPETPRPEGFVPSWTLWWADGDEYLGRIQMRHPLTEGLRELGGHIGYDVAPEHRRKGHATAMLAAMLPIVAAHYPLDQVLVTCDTDNLGSRKVIEANGGELEDERSGKLRYWVPVAA
jgi:predicted acetyltransferase